ncbi:MAG TPA: hypothetical protein VJB70_05165 [Candidatus Paceibacterota bacterium]
MAEGGIFSLYNIKKFTIPTNTFNSPSSKTPPSFVHVLARCIRFAFNNHLCKAQGDEYFMKHFLRKLFVFLSFTLTILAAYFAYLQYSVQRDEARRFEDPLIQYAYSDDKNAFVVSGGTDVEIKGVVWTMPSVAASAPFRIGRHPLVLPLNDLLKQIYDESTDLFSGVSLPELKELINCDFLKNDMASGIPLVAEVTYRQRGEEGVHSVKSLLYAEWLTSANPYIAVYEEQASSKEEEHFLRNAMRDLKGKFDQLRQGKASRLASAEECHGNNAQTHLL